jgi:hypothetical protein
MQKKAIRIKRRRQADWSPQKIAQYSLVLTAQHENSMSGLKILLSLSAGGIGLLVGLSNFLSFLSIGQMFFWGCSIFLFFLAILFIMKVHRCKFDFLDMSKRQLLSNDIEQKNILNAKKNEIKKNHRYYALCIALSFVFAVASMAIFGGITIYEKNNSKRDNKIKQVRVIGPVQTYPMLQKK